MTQETKGARYIVERRDAKRWAVIDQHGRTKVTRLVNEYATRRDARNLADALNRKAETR